MRSKSVWTGGLKYPDAPVHFWADPHLGHDNIIAYCGRKEFMSSREREIYDAWMAEGGQRSKKPTPHMSVETVRRMDDALLALVNKYVPADAILALLGDFCWGHHDTEASYTSKASRYRNAIKCRKIHMVWGNHDGRCIERLFTWTNEKVIVSIQHDHQAVLSHEACFFWINRHRGARHYYGHTHGFGEAELEAAQPGRFSQDAGVDNAYKLVGEYRPFSDAELEAVMKTRPGYGLLKDAL